MHTNTESTAIPGASVAGLGIYDNKFAHNSSVGSYAVDGQQPTYFLIENLSSNELSSLSNQVLFQTIQYPPGPHQIEIVYYGSSETAPLIMTSLLVHNQTMNLDNSSLTDVTLPATPSTSIPLPTATTTTSSGKQGINSSAPIISEFCGAFLGVLGVLGLFILYNRRRRQLRELAVAERTASPFPTMTGQSVVPASKLLRHLRFDPERSQITPPERPNPLRKTRRLVSAHILSSIMRTRQAPPAQINTDSDMNSRIPRRSPSLRLLVHEDSGVRLQRPIENQITVVEVPPTYTPL
uniref:Uncharacterized protein n=1 Tax=Psilocybe cubensis TaxID=181762 RepID=A0A8H8CEZ7_PSICU